MKSDVDKAISQVGVIHDAIERSQSRWEELWRILIAYGGVRLFLYVLQSCMVWFPTSFLCAIIQIVAKGVLYAGLFVYFALLYRREKGASDKYYLGCLNLFGFIVFALPLSSFLLNLALNFRQNAQVQSQRMTLMGDQEQIANMLLFCLCAVICGLMRERRGVTAGSVLILIVYLLLSVPLRDAGFIIPLIVTKIGTPRFLYYGIYYNLVTSVGYIVIGVLLKRPGRRSNGDQ